jgi:hypothetical protein
VNAMLRRAAVERDAEQARLAYLQRMHEIEVCMYGHLSCFVL